AMGDWSMEPSLTQARRRIADSYRAGPVGHDRERIPSHKVTGYLEDVMRSDRAGERDKELAVFIMPGLQPWGYRRARLMLRDRDVPRMRIAQEICRIIPY